MAIPAVDFSYLTYFFCEGSSQCRVVSVRTTSTGICLAYESQSSVLSHHSDHFLVEMWISKFNVLFLNFVDVLIKLFASTTEGEYLNLMK